MVTNILNDVQYNYGEFPREILLKAIEQRDEIVPELLGILEYTCENAEKIAEEEDYFAHIYALYLLAQFREQRAYPLICVLLNKPNEIPEKLLGDIITEGLSGILASVFNGDVKPLKCIIENEQIDEFIRAAALNSLIVLVAKEIITRDEVVVYFQNLFHGGLNREYSYIWDALVGGCCDLHPEETFEDIELAYDEDLISPTSISFDEIKEQLSKSKQIVLEELHDSSIYQLIDDTIHELEWWACFDQKQNNRMPVLPVVENVDIERTSIKKVMEKPYRIEYKVGRNDPCPCESVDLIESHEK